MRFQHEKEGGAFPVVLTLLALLGIPFVVGLLVRYDSLQTLERASDERLTLYESTLVSALEKYEYLPYLVAGNDIVLELLEGADNAREVDEFLDAANRRAGTAALYVVNSEGVVVAAGNWREADSFVGLDLSFRPYFSDAMAGREGRFYGVGISAGEPGYYISHPIRKNGVVLGGAIAKIGLSSLESLWQEGSETVFVTDAEGVIVLSSRPAWKYRTMTPLSEETRRKIHERWQYPGLKLKHLPSERVSRMGYLEEVLIGKERFLEKTRDVPEMHWKIVYLMPQDVLWERTLGIGLTTFVLVGLAVLTRLFLGERRQKEKSRRHAREAERTRRINTKLAQEIEERKRTETELREAQEELVQAGKLAALGEMATAVAHELNQPIAAAKTYIASCRLMLERGRLDEVAPTLAKISDLGDRMADVTGQLKSFVRKSSGKKSEFDLRQAVDESLTLMAHQMQVEKCALELDMPSEPVLVLGDRVRLEQVLINLFRNALDSMQDTASPVIHVGLSRGDGRAEIHVQDNGPGIDPEVGSRLFEPFVTTKKEGVGLGLGLSISYKIIKDMGGDLRGGNRPEEGAEFIVYIPSAPDEENG